MEYVLNAKLKKGNSMNCHTVTHGIITQGNNIALVGHPNVGKSVIFQRLTGQHVTVSNYPGTTVEVTRGSVRKIPETYLVDTPGIITFPPHSDDELVTEKVLFNEPLRAILQVGDAKNLRRTILLSLQLAEMGIPMVLALNMMDEARHRGVEFDAEKLAKEMGVPIVPTAAIRGHGIDKLLSALEAVGPPQFQLDYPEEIESLLIETMTEIDLYLPTFPISLRSLALLWISSDPVCNEWLQTRLPKNVFESLIVRRTQLDKSSEESLATRIQTVRLHWVEQILPSVLLHPGSHKKNLASVLGRLTTHPIWGLFILAIVLYALYWFVGILGAGILVGFLENTLFGIYINPWMTSLVVRLIPYTLIQEFLVGEFGLWTMGVTYSVALILPIVTTFFIAFGIMEDSGYLPRLAALSNRFFEKLGLNGKAVLPMVLGLGCVTMATLTTRVMESKRERLLVTLLLALAIPCSAQLGVVMGMLAGISFSATLIWGGVIFLIMLAVGWLAARAIPGERTALLVELPPMRWPVISNVLMKTWVRLEWYLKEVFPLFLIGSAIMFALSITGILETLIKIGEPLVTGWLGLPAEASAAFLMGFLRRDFGATGLFQMQIHGLLTPIQVVVAMVTITLFIPCLASMMVIAKERGWKSALGIVAFVMPLAFLIGGLLFRALSWFGWGG